LIRLRSKRFLVVAAAIAALAVFLLPAFVAFRYTAPSQRSDFIQHPWRGWGFVYAALAVPGDAELKTSGMALRKADWVFKGTVVDPREIQLVFVPEGKPYRFIWQVQGAIDTISERTDTVVAMLDYATGRVLYDVRDDLLPSELTPEPASSPQPASSPSSLP
jgi:hypothetical protein